MAVNTIDRESARDHPWPAETTTEALENSTENIILCNFCVFKIKFCSLSVFTVCVHSVFTLFASGACEAYHAARLRRRIDGKKSSDSQSEVQNAKLTMRNSLRENAFGGLAMLRDKALAVFRRFKC